nr:hypothetical protein [Tanacetum cinerariifolium]
MNGLKAYDGEVNLEFDENLISNEFTVKLCLDYKVKKGKKLVRKELIVALKGELYFVKFIINPEEDDSKLGVILGRSFLGLAHGVVDFGNGNFLHSYARWRKSNHNKKKTMENLNLFYQDIRPSSSPGSHLIQEEAEKEALTVKISQKFALLEGERPAKAIRKLSNVLCQVGVTTIIAKFLILDIPIDRDAPIVVGRGFLYTMGSILNTPDRLFSTFDRVYHQTFRAIRFDVPRTAESDSDDEEEYVIKRNRSGAPIYGMKPAPYLNCTNLEDRSQLYR